MLETWCPQQRTSDTYPKVLVHDTIAQWWQFKADDPIALQGHCSSHDVPIDAH